MKYFDGMKLFWLLVMMGFFSTTFGIESEENLFPLRLNFPEDKKTEKPSKKEDQVIPELKLWGVDKSPKQWCDIMELEGIPSLEVRDQKSASIPRRVFYLDYIYLPDNRPEEDLERFYLHQFRLGLLPKIYLTPNIIFGFGFEYSTYSFHFDFVDGEENVTFHSLSFPIDLMYLSKRVFFWGRFYPGLHTDFNRVNEDSFQVQGGGIFGYQLVPQLWIGAGVFFVDDFGKPFPVPVGGIYWSPIPELIVNVIAPKRAMISCKILPRCYIFSYFEVDGAQVRFLLTRKEPHQDETVQFSFMKAGGGFSYEISRGLYLNVLGGTNFRSRFKFRQFDDMDRRFTSYHFPFFMVSFSLNADFFSPTPSASPSR